MCARTVLIVDDDPGIVGLLREMLADEGYRVLVATNGRDALTLARQERPDLVVSDVMMPRLSGIELALALRYDPALMAIPVVLMSAGQTDVAAVPWAPFLEKPFTIEGVLALVQAHIRSG